MLATFKETIASLQDKFYGQKIVLLRPAPVIWYWTKYVLLFSAIPIILVTISLTRYVPELPKFLRENLPPAQITMEAGHLTTFPSQVFTWGDSQFSLILNTTATPSALDDYASVILIQTDKIEARDNTGQVQSFSFEKFPNFSFTKDQLIDWVSSHQAYLWGIGMVAVLVVSAIATAGFWLFKLLSFFFWGALLWLLSRIIKRQINFIASFQIVVYASILPLLLTAITTIAPNRIISLLGQVIFIYFAFTWAWNLPQLRQADPIPVVPDISPTPPFLPSPKPRSRKSKSSSHN